MLPLLVALFGCLAFGASANPSSPKEAAVENLESESFFAIGGIGFAGTPSDGEQALRKLLAKPDAKARLQRLLASKSPVTQLYALLGLRQVDRPAYTEASRLMENSKVVVKTMAGCISGQATVSDLARRIREGKYDFPFTKANQRR